MLHSRDKLDETVLAQVDARTSEEVYEVLEVVCVKSILKASDRNNNVDVKFELIDPFYESNEDVRVVRFPQGFFVLARKVKELLNQPFKFCVWRYEEEVL
jgi:hypothetical protein